MLTLTADKVFILVVLTINFVVWAVLSIPRNRAKLPKIYLIARSWLWMLLALFISYWLASYESYDHSHNPYEWVAYALFIIIGLRGTYEILRLWQSQTKSEFIAKLVRNKVQPETAEPINSGKDKAKKITANEGQSHQHIIDLALALGFALLIISLMVLCHLTLVRQQQGVFLFVIFASQFNDIAQYLCGRFLGGRLFKRKLAPAISPNKTIEGAFFGSILSAILATLIGLWLTPFPIWLCFVIAYFLAVTGIIGDLLESAFKRRHGVKDTGTMLAGHGGILDRVDSLLIGIPIFTLVYWTGF